MASTYTPNAAVTLVQNFVHGIPLAAVAPNVCDMVNSMMWVYYPWSWTISTLSAINLVDGTQDYTPTDTDILRPLKLRIVRTDVTPNEWRELMILSNLSPELSRKAGIETMKAITLYPSINKFRFDVAVGLGAPQTLQLQGEYQKVPTRISTSNMDTAFTFPDRYFNVFVEGLKWKIYQLSDDPRAGAPQADNRGNVMDTGQLAVYKHELARMARTEDLAAGDEFMFPEQPLGVGRSYWPGIYGI